MARYERKTVLLLRSSAQVDHRQLGDGFGYHQRSKAGPVRQQLTKLTAKRHAELDALEAEHEKRSEEYLETDDPDAIAKSG